MKFYLAREGVAFGPYTEFQVLESVRLGIFERHDLALAEDGKEWLEVSRLLPINGASRELPSAEPSASPVADGPPEKAPVAPLGNYQLREHETYFAAPPVVSLTTEFFRGKLPVAAASAAVAVVCLLTLAIAHHHRKAPAQAALPRFSAKAPATETLAKPAARLTPVSLPVSNALPAQAVPVATPAPAVVSATPPPSSPEPVEPPMASQSPAGRIEGHMLIATMDGLNYEPSSVEVRLFPLALLKPYLEKRSSEASAKFEELKAQIEAAEADKERLRKASDAAFDAYVRAEAGSPNKAALEQASTDAKKAREKAANAYYDLMQSREDLLSGAFYLQDLPKSTAVTQTDSQGRFSFDVAADGEFAVVAGVQKNENDSTQRYYWFIPVSVANEPTKAVLLSNNNLSSQGSADSLVLTID